MTFHDVVVNVQCGPGSHNVHCHTCPLGGLVGTSKAIGYPSLSRAGVKVEVGLVGSSVRSMDRMLLLVGLWTLHFAFNVM